MNKRQRNMLLREVKKNTAGWDDREQIKEYKRRLFEINRKNSWDGTYRNMYRPEMTFETKEQRILKDWLKVFQPKFPGRVVLAVRQAIDRELQGLSHYG